MIAASCVAAGLLLVALRLGLFSPVPRIGAEPVRRVETDRKWVAITFDGPVSPRWTPAILSTLRQYAAPCTFFPWGASVDRQPNLVRAIVAEGHEVGAAPLLPGPLERLGPGALRREVWAASVRLEAVTGVRVVYFRSPDGGAMGDLARAAAADGEHLVWWDVDGGRPRLMSPKTTTRRIMQGVRRGAIIRLWQGPAAAQTLALLLPELSAEGYKPVSLTRLLGVGRPAGAPLGFGPLGP